MTCAVTRNWKWYCGECFGHGTYLLYSSNQYSQNLNVSDDDDEDDDNDDDDDENDDDDDVVGNDDVYYDDDDDDDDDDDYDELYLKWFKKGIQS